MDHTDNHPVRRAEPELDFHADHVGAATLAPEPKLDELPLWLAPGAEPAPANRLGRPLYAWGGTLTATALMVAFGLWLGNEPAPLAQQIAATPSAPAPVPEVRSSGPVPPLVLLPPTTAAPSASTVPAPATIARHTAAKSKVQGRAGMVLRKPVVSAKGRTTTLAARAQVKPRATTMASPVGERWSNRVAAIDNGNTRRMRCKRGELARECLARYR